MKNLRHPLWGRTATILVIFCVPALAFWFLTERDRSQEEPFVGRCPAYRRVTEGMTEAQVIKLLGTPVVVWNNPHYRAFSTEEVSQLRRDQATKERDTDAAGQRMEDAYVSSSPELGHLKRAWERCTDEQDGATKAFRRVIKQSWTYRPSGWSGDITIAFDSRGLVVYYNAALDRSLTDNDPAFG